MSNALAIIIYGILHVDAEINLTERMNFMRRALSVVLCVILIFGVVAPMSAFAADDYSLIYTYSDIQTNKTSYDLRYGTNSNHIEWQWLPSYDGGRIVYLAQNEYEGFQVYFYERTAGGRLLDISVSPFLNADGEELSAEVYNEVYMIPKASLQTSLPKHLSRMQAREFRPSRTKIMCSILS